jgi:hypothetical protein
MKYILFFSLIVSAGKSQVTGLEGWDLFIDPGHSRDENMGINGYSEAKEVLRVGLHLMDIFENQTDIDTVYISRTNDSQSVSLYQRTNYANTVGASWYHSIHSDASSNTNLNKTLLLWGQLYNGNPDPPVGGEEMSSYMIDILTAGMRTQTTGSWGDCSFYTWSDYCANSGGPYLYVNRNTNMPSELSEEGHHTNPPQNQLTMNEEYKRMLAYLFFWSILEHHEIDRPFVGQLSGQIFDIESQDPINGAVTHAGDFEYTTDTYTSLFHNYSNDEHELRNGFYWFEGLSDSTYEVIVSAPGYYSDTTNVAIADSFITFHDIQLLSSQPPIVVGTVPAEGDTLFPAWENIEVNFSRPMNTEIVEACLLLNPGTDHQIIWSDDNLTMTIESADMDYETDYTLTILDDAQDVYGHYLDGNADDTPGGDFILTFRSGPADMEPPQILAVVPPNVAQNVELRPIINIQFDEIVGPESMLESSFLLERFQDHTEIEGELDHYTVYGRSSLCFFPFNDILPNEVYVTRVYSGLMDEFNNAIPVNHSYSFLTGNVDVDVTMIDAMEQNVEDNWWAPQVSGSTTGIVTDSTSMLINPETVNGLYGSTQAMEIDYGWNTTAVDWLIRVYLSGGLPRNVTFDDSKTLQAYIFGDGSGNKFRFAVDDNLPNTGADYHEVSPWYPIDWIGWKLISWDMDMDETGDWIGDGQLNGTMRFDSFQLTYAEGQPAFGKILIDDFRLIADVDLDISVNGLPNKITLDNNYPNPFNISTMIPFIVDKTRPIRLTVYDLAGHKIRELVNKKYQPGNHQVFWQGKTDENIMASSGIYIYMLVSNEFSKSGRMVLLK